MDLELNKHIAVHEAGHAILLYKLWGLQFPDPFVYPEIVAESETEAHVTIQPVAGARVWPTHFEALLMFALAGPEAEKLHLGRVGGVHDGDELLIQSTHERQLEALQEDRRNEWQSNYPWIVSPEDPNWRELLRDRVMTHLNEPEWRSFLLRVAQALLEFKRLTFGQFVSLAINHFGRSHWPVSAHVLVENRNLHMPWMQSVRFAENDRTDVLPVFPFRADSISLMVELKSRLLIPEQYWPLKTNLTELINARKGNYDFVAFDPVLIDNRLHAVSLVRMD